MFARCESDRARAPFTGRPPLLAALLLFVTSLAVFATGCATYTDSVRKAKTEVTRGQTNRAVAEINKSLRVKDSQIPVDLADENVLLLLERATLLQALDNYKASARDMMIADQRLDWLDIDASDNAELGKYLFSGDSATYAAPAYERLLLNTLNMVNFLALGDLEGARVEARRFSIVETFFIDNRGETLLYGLFALGNYLGGATFEASGDYETAARYYSRAWHFGMRTERLRDRLADLLAITNYKATELTADDQQALQDILTEANTRKPLSYSEYREKYVNGETIVLLQTGLVPYKEGKSFPVGQALTIAAASSMEEGKATKARSLAAAGTLSTINFPILTEKSIPVKRNVGVKIGGSEAPLHEGMNVRKQVKQAWDKIKGELMAAAITRMITRAVAGEAAGAVGEELGGGLLGFAAQLGTQIGMSAADTPDTRSWSMLPSFIHVSRRKLEPGEHKIKVRVDNQTDTKTVKVNGEGLNIVNFSRLR